MSLDDVANRAFGIQDSTERLSKPPRKADAPFSMRLSDEERAELNIMAGNQAWATYIRSEIFGNKTKKRRVLRKPDVDDRKVSMVLSALGESRLSQNMNQLAKHANMGTLEISEPVEQEIVEACRAIVAMREALLSALGHRA